jgi:16S rRNA (cytosine967-C5)-methyltransferase
MTESGADSRAAAVRAVAAVLADGVMLEAALEAAAAAPSDRAFAQALAFGALRFGHRLRRVAVQLLPRPWDDQKPAVQALLLVGLYQLEYAGTAPHAAVSATVAAARMVGATGAAGLINACLRRYQRERDALLAGADETQAGRWSHPDWFAEQLMRDWPDHWERILEANNAHPPLTLRARRGRISRDSLAAELAENGMVTHAVSFAADALDLEVPTDVRSLPAFVAGRCSVQDAAAQLAAPLLAAGPGMRVLDACAAPGGKTGHLLELVPGLSELVAVDIDAQRARRIRDNLARLGLTADVRIGDAANPEVIGEALYDRILLDAPCSGTGVIRRHPDIKWLRRPRELPGLAARQRDLLQALWRRLKPGGRLVYATCSVLRAENMAVVQGFLRDTADAADVTNSASLALTGLPPLPEPRGPGLVLLPGYAGTDGFYYACLERRAT